MIEHGGLPPSSHLPPPTHAHTTTTQLPSRPCRSALHRIWTSLRNLRRCPASRRLWQTSTLGAPRPARSRAGAPNSWHASPCRWRSPSRCRLPHLAACQQGIKPVGCAHCSHSVAPVPVAGLAAGGTQPAGSPLTTRRVRRWRARPWTRHARRWRSRKRCAAGMAVGGRSRGTSCRNAAPRGCPPWLVCGGRGASALLSCVCMQPVQPASAAAALSAAPAFDALSARCAGHPPARSGDPALP